MADYPASLPAFDEKFDYRTIIFADHVNKLQNELSATQTTLGANVLVSSGWVGSFDTATTTWSTVKARLQNIEYGLKKAYDERVNTAGGSTVTPSAVGVIGLIFKAITSQTSNLTEWRNVSNSVISYVDKDGEIYTSSKKLVPVVYGSTQPSSVPVGTIWIDSSSSVGTLNLEGVVPDGGTTGQVLTKISGTDYDYDWDDVQSGESGFNPFLLGGM